MTTDNAAPPISGVTVFDTVSPNATAIGAHPIVSDTVSSNATAIPTTEDSQGNTVSTIKNAYESLRQLFEISQATFERTERAYIALQQSSEKVKLELERKNIELQQAKTMAALGEMSATVAHEIRNPLGAMGIWAGQLERALDPQDPKRKPLGKITEGLARLNKIVTNLLVYTRPISTEFRKVRLDALLDEIVDFTEIEIERLGRDIAVEKGFTNDEAMYVMADPEKMNQAIINLCLNAVQAMEDGGKLRVTLTHASQNIKFSIIDTGSGIEEELLGKIFDPFFTTKEDGTGLGLAIVKKIIESHGGIIEIKSDVGIGTCVSCYLPEAK